MQKIKYPVGSKLENKFGKKMVVGDISPNGTVCFLVDSDEQVSLSPRTQYELDTEGYTLVSSPRWIPKPNETYWSWNDGKVMFDEVWQETIVDLFRLKQGKVCKNFEECQKKIDEINSREI